MRRGDYAVLFHDHPFPHFDWMFESGRVLATWRAALPPPLVRKSARAERIADHRLAYLSYEGPVARARGKVVRVEAGRYEARRARRGGWRVRMEASSGKIREFRVSGRGKQWRVERVRGEKKTPSAKRPGRRPRGESRRGRRA